MIRVWLPQHLRTLAGVSGEVELACPAPPTLGGVLDALEERYPVLCGTIRDRQTRQRRPLLRFYACEQDLSLGPWETPLPEPVAAGREPLLVIGALGGG